MEIFKRALTSLFKALSTPWTIFLLVSPSAFAQNTFSFIEYNVAFSLGLSLPLIIIAFIIRDRIKNSWWYLVLLTSSLLWFLFTLTTSQNSIFSAQLYSAAALFTLLMSLLPRTASISSDTKSNRVLWCYYFALISFIIFISNTWLVNVVSNHYFWAIYAAGLLMINFVRIQQVHEIFSIERFRYIFVSLLLFTFASLIFMKQHWQISNAAIVISAVICFMFALVNYAWRLSARIKTSVTEEVALSYLPKIDELTLLSRDAVTKLPNQGQAIKTMQNEVDNKSEFNYAVLVFKPINFQQVNHLLGHQNSDLLLIQLAFCLQNAVENNVDLVNFNHSNKPIRIARLPGLEFLIVVDLCHQKYEPELHIEQLRRDLCHAVPEAISFKSFSLNFELAFGIDFFNEKSPSIKDTLGWASDALLHAEKSQLASSFYDHKNSVYTDDILLQMEQLKAAIDDDNLLWHCQPQIHLITKEIIGFELGVCWQSPAGETLNIEEFIDIAKCSGELFTITKQLINKAAELAQKLKQQEINIPVTINFSAIETFEDTLVDFIETCIEKNQLDNNAIVIEISEPALNLEQQKAKRLIDQMRFAGLKIAIDKFSGSYESLKYLRKIAINQLKIDCGGLTISENRQTEKAIIDALVNLGKVMHVPLVGFNINTAQALELFQDIGGIYAQGNVISPTIGTGQLIDWVNAWQVQNPTA